MTENNDSQRQQAINQTKQKVQYVIPHIPYLSSQQFQTLQTKDDQDKLFLIDVRTPEEYDVSTIQGAVPQSMAQQKLSQIKQSSPHVICFCTVGLRSGLYAHQLEQQGYQVSNYSIMEHLNGGGQLITNDGQPWQRQVHSFDSAHSRLIPEDCNVNWFSIPTALYRSIPYIPSILSALISRNQNKTKQNSSSSTS